MKRKLKFDIFRQQWPKIYGAPENDPRNHGPERYQAILSVPNKGLGWWKQYSGVGDGPLGMVVATLRMIRDFLMRV